MANVELLAIQMKFVYRLFRLNRMSLEAEPEPRPKTSEPEPKAPKVPSSLGSA